jgi:prepilin-type N-terminal cleavage/methylation domain-containing protein
MKNLKKIYMKKTAFTLIELILVIVVLGILAALAIPRYDRDLRQEAVDNILSALRYTKHMALTDNVANPRDNKWQRAFWRFGIEKCSDNGIFYYISSDKDYEGDIDSTEIINDPANGKKMMGDNNADCETQVNNNASPNIFLTKKYGIKDGDITFTNCGNGSGSYLGFDYFGRPHRSYAGSSGSTYPDYASILHTDCNITINFSNSGLDPISIIVESGTGHAYIDGQLDS